VKPPRIVKELGYSRGNVHRLLATLEELGFVELIEDRGYRLTYKMFKLGNKVIEHSKLEEVAHPFLGPLAEKAGEDVCLTVLYEKSIIIVERIKSANLLTLDHDVAHTYPLHCSASGKLFLSSFDDESLWRLLEDLDLEKRTERTITDKNALFQEIFKIRKLGYSLDLREYSEDIHTIAAPIYDYTRRIVATISISGPSQRLTEAKMQTLVNPLLQTAEEISRKMGCDQAGNMNYKKMQKAFWESKKVVYRSNNHRGGM
ncbi:MAG: hypothetical protein DRP87_04185, partial [Spirochaetes bacterium]